MTSNLGVDSIVFLALIIWILFTHFVADFVLQTDYQAKNKSKDSGVLMLHCLTYTLCLFTWTTAYIGLEFWYSALLFATINGSIHFIIDFCTSRVTSSLFGKKDYHNGFIAVGFDQYLHTLILLITSYRLCQIVS